MACFLQKQYVQILSNDVILNVVDLGLPFQIAFLMPFAKVLNIPLNIVSFHIGPINLPEESCDECLVHHPIKTSKKINGLLRRCQVVHQVLVLFK